MARKPPPLQPFRVPKGVPSDIRRALRLGKPGRFLSTVKALQLHDLLAVKAKEGQKAHNRVLRAFEKARLPQTRQKHLGRLRALQRDYGAIQHGLDQLAESSGFAPLPPLPSPDVVPVTTRDVEESPDYALEEEGALEIEVGVDYLEAEGWRHRQATSDVSFNARLFRRDRRPMTESEARAAMFAFAESGNFPRGIEARTVSWQDYKGRTGRGTEDDLENFRAILQRVGDGGLRIGLVKED